MARPQHISDDSIIEALATDGEVTAADLADRLGIGQSTAAKRLAALEASGSVLRQPGGRVNGVRVADHWSVATMPSDDTADSAVPFGARAVGAVNDASNATKTDATNSAAPKSGGERLERGALGALVRDYLAARPDEDLGPSQVGKALGRSQGAVSNALARLETAGEARLVTVTPRRYRIVTKR
ncbi:MAG: winged helix-turn-helix transcriptional regulator [Actinomycetes bacterium]